jgi:TonB-dependent SusC/RagA subfamily outer membrane receptor
MHMPGFRVPMRGPAVAAAALALAVTAPPAPLRAQPQTGVVIATVSDRTTARPLEAVRVQIAGTTVGGATDARGRVLIRGVPAGAQTVRFVRIGYRPESQAVSVAANDSVTLTAALVQSAIELAAVVTTGTGGAVEKRRIGSAIGTVDMAELQERVPITDIGQALAAKVPGLRSTAVGGGAGAAKDLRIRGVSSFSLNQRPVVYIDGVRVDKRAEEWTSTTGLSNKIACCAFAGGTSTDRLSDINPDDIERVEVLKGAAAATLYGSEASNGVIQIFTKRGKSDSRPSWSASATTGFDRLRENLPTKLFPRFSGPDGTQARDANELIENGAYQDYDLSVQGGGQRNTYFISTGYLDNKGSIQPNRQRKGNLRLNLNFLPSDKWSIEARSLFTRNDIDELQAGNNWTALLGNAINGNPRNATKEKPFGEAWVPVSDIQKIETTSSANRWTGGLTLNYSMLPTFTHRFTAGLDAVNDEKGRFFPYFGAYGPAGVTNGQRNVGPRNYTSVTFDYLASLTHKLPFGIGGDLAVGGQGFRENERLSLSVGNTFAGPGVSTVSSSSVQTAGEVYSEVVNLGAYAQERLAFGNKLFATLGLRIDGNSAFGKNYGFKQYPKADVSWVVSEYGFLPDWVSSLKLRSAIGTAGKTPGAFDQFQTFASRSVYTGTPGVVPDNPGNPDIRPETTTEIEAGIDAGFLGDRLGVEASVYKATTKDAIVPKPNAPSAGFANAARVNIGAIENIGWEASVNYLVFSTRRLEWSTNVRLDGNKNEVTDLGGVVLTGNTVRLGYPVQGVWDRVATGFSVRTGGTCPSYGCPTTTRGDTAVYLGSPLPTFNGAFGNTFRFGPFQLYGLLTMERGAVFSNGDRPYRVRQGGADEYLQFLGPNGERTFQADSVAQYWSILNAVDSRDNVRLREISLSYVVPTRFSNRLRLGRTMLQLSGQNVTWWDDCNCVDPNMNFAGGDSFTIASGFLAQPSPRSFRFTVQTRF